MADNHFEAGSGCRPGHKQDELEYIEQTGGAWKLYSGVTYSQEPEVLVWKNDQEVLRTGWGVADMLPFLAGTDIKPCVLHFNKCLTGTPSPPSPFF